MVTRSRGILSKGMKTMKRLFSRKDRPHNEKNILSIQYGDCVFGISERDTGSYTVSFYVNRKVPGHGYLFGGETLPCSASAVEEVFDLLKRHCVIDLLEEVKQSEFRDIECHPPHFFSVKCDHAGLQYSFNDFYGCGYAKSSSLETQLCMTRLMLDLAGLFFLVRQGKL